ncbi:hypothetical protein VHEMI04524 [[Torrubiella] hemipterigena]|uniref:Ketoreductase domain-containing protein n=1 Tax=[Torrubiella] hemipterigena TaxID=1531966 RepID=A0A0A1T1K4_9HYPO|nr:hypothetical protein VHEMI04524 [[Torrubiella] hemipterigena]
MSLLGKTFVITGGASGIGKATVQKLLELSATVHSIDKSKNIPQINEHAGCLYSYGGVDISARHAVKDTFTSIMGRSTILNGLVNCAGILRTTQLSEEADADFETLWRVNVQGTWNVGTEFYRHAYRASANAHSDEPVAETAAVVNIASMAGVKSYPGLSAYVTSKHAVVGLTKSMALEWGHKGIRVNCIAPGKVLTPMVLQPPPSMPEIQASKPDVGVIKDALSADEIADTVLYLLSSASSGVVGQTIEVNGGHQL